MRRYMYYNHKKNISDGSFAITSFALVYVYCLHSGQNCFLNENHILAVKSVDTAMQLDLRWDDFLSGIFLNIYRCYDTARLKCVLWLLQVTSSAI